MLLVSGIEKESIVDGEGWRYTIFMQGCNHYCEGCQNPETWDFEAGTRMFVDDIIYDISNNFLLDGVTLSGGDPLFQASELIELCKEIKKLKLDIWIYTGFSFEEFINFKNNLECDKRINKDMLKLIKYAKVVVDGKFILSQKSLETPYKGSTNQRIVDVKKSLASNKVIEYKLKNRGSIMKMICLMGRSGSGKSTIESSLEKIGFKRSISYTTRKPRTRNGKQEEDGVEYRFVTEEKFMQLYNSGKIIEYERYDENLYGTPRPHGGKNHVAVVCIGGYRELKKLYKDQVLGVYLKCDDTEHRDVAEAHQRNNEDNDKIAMIEKEADIIINSNQDVNVIIAEILKTFKLKEEN